MEESVGAHPRYKTPERIAILKELWPLEMPTSEIMDRINALEGPPPPYDILRHWAQDYGVRRPRQYMVRERMVKREQYREQRWEASATPMGAFDPDWPPRQINMAIDLWNQRPIIPSTQIAFRMRTTKGAIVGKLRRLKQQGFPVLDRGSPIIVAEDDLRRVPDARKHVATKGPAKVRVKKVRPVPTPKVKPPRSEKRIPRVFRGDPPPKQQPAKPQLPPSLLAVARGGHDTPFGIGTLSRIDFARIKPPPKGRCAWPFTCANPTDGHLCDIHRGLIRQAA